MYDMRFLGLDRMIDIVYYSDQARDVTISVILSIVVVVVDVVQL